MRVLALETSERVGTLATLKTEGDVASVVETIMLPAEQRSAQSLLPVMKSLLDKCGWSIAQLDLIAVTTGPGSFTGLRIGVTTAKTLAYATGTKLVEVHTLAAMAHGAEFTETQRLWTILDAQRKELFVAKFDSDWQTQGSLLPETRILAVDQWLAELRAEDVVSGPPLKKLADRLPNGVRVVDAERWAPSAEMVGQLGWAAYQRGLEVDAMQLVPRYYRKSAAEEKAET